MASNACMEIEFLAGTDIETAIREASNKARIFDLAYVKFSFNGVKLSIGRTADIEKAADSFRQALGSKKPTSKYVIEQ